LSLPLSDSLSPAAEDSNSFDVPTLKLWVLNYVNYHNAAAAYLKSITPPDLGDDALIGDGVLIDEMAPMNMTGEATAE